MAIKETTQVVRTFTLDLFENSLEVKVVDGQVRHIKLNGGGSPLTPEYLLTLMLENGEEFADLIDRIKGG